MSGGYHPWSKFNEHRWSNLNARRHGWAQVTEKPLRVGVDSFWRKAGNTSNAEKAELLRKELNKAIRNGQINSRDELCTYMDQLLGLTITRTGKDYVSVKFPDGAKAVRLKGAMFDSQTDYATLRSATTQSHGTEKFSVPEYQQARARLACLLSYRANELSGNSSARKPKTITTKENNYGIHKKRLGRINGSSAEHQRGDSIYVPTSGMERNLFQESSGQRRYTHDGGRQESHGGPQKNPEPDQHAFHANSGNAGTKRRRGAGGFQPTYGQTLNEQIRELGIQLLECEQYSQEAAAIMAKINVLVGAREQLPRGPKFKS